ncbi:hypothetical protein EV426DRAFT_699927 [Tirmania nivea]|nr:hypothetical protein EV426DRAFT_699927 [Tirmania nivea]
MKSIRRRFHSSSIIQSFSRQSTILPPPTAEERRRAAERLLRLELDEKPEHTSSPPKAEERRRAAQSQPLPQLDEKPEFTPRPEPLPPHNISEDAAASFVSKLLGSASSKLDGLPTAPDIHSRFKLPTKWSNALVLRPIVRETLKKAYPLMEDLTPIQAKLLAALSKRTHLALTDIPGTGKSFALATWLLNIDRSTTTVSGEVEPTTTALVLVPSADLAMQYELWISNILARSGSEAIEGDIAGFIQCLYRTSTVDGDGKQKKRLEEHPKPHIIVATPNRVLDLLEEGLQSPRKLLDLEHLRMVAVDEADSLLDLEFEWAQPSKNSQQALQVPKVSPTGSSGGHDRRKEKGRAGPPAEQLLDYIFNLRNKKLLTPRRAKGELNYIQLVLASSSKGAKGMRRWIEREKRSWLSPYGSAWAGGMQGAVNEAKGMDMGFAPKYMPVKEGDLVSPIITTLQREGTARGAVLRKVHQSVKHHILAYDMETGLLRDAPLKRQIIERKLREFLKLNSKSGLVGGLRKSEPVPAGNIVLLDEKEKKAIGDDSYPEEITVPILEKLLEHDNWPEQVIVGLGTQTSKISFQKTCEEIGIKAENLSFQSWNSQSPEIPKLGRSDEHIASFTPPPSTASKEGRKRTKVWITDPVSCTGLDCPGITHAYLFHRIESTKDYVAYCGRVSRHPFAEHTNSAAWVAFDVSSDEEPGKIKSRIVTPGKVVSIIFEEHITPEELEAEREAEKVLLAKEKEEGLFMLPGELGGYKPGKGEKVVRVISGQDESGRGGREVGLPVVQRGGMFEKDVYLFEGIRREKIGCVVEPYFKEEVGVDVRKVGGWEDVEDDIEDCAEKLWGLDDPLEVQMVEEREVLKTDSENEALAGKGHEAEMPKKDSEDEILAEKGHVREVEEGKLGEEGRIVPDELQEPSPPPHVNAETETIDATAESPADSQSPSDIVPSQKPTKLPSNPEAAIESQPLLQEQPEDE